MENKQVNYMIWLCMQFYQTLKKFLELMQLSLK